MKAIAEHFGLHYSSVSKIIMNGRGYDYQLGRFLSVDPFVQFPAHTQSANPYSYVLNNPLSGTDPSGYMPKFGCGNTAATAIDRDAKSCGNLGAGSWGGGESKKRNGSEGGEAYKSRSNTGAESVGKPDPYDLLVNTLQSGGSVAIGNFIPDFVNGIISWVERWPTIDQGALPRMDSWVLVETEMTQQVASDIRVAAGGVLVVAPVFRAAGVTNSGVKALPAPKVRGNPNTAPNHGTITVTNDGVALVGSKHQIPSNYVQNPHRPGNYGEIVNGKFKERLRIDPATPPGQKGPNYSHYHKNGKGKHYSPREGDPDPGF